VPADWRAALDSNGELPPRSDVVEPFSKMAHLTNLEAMGALLGE
jgi:hypothetical protein